MGKLKIHMTLDYEVWGNGNGCVIECMITPTNRLLEIAERFNLKVTVFVDVCEYWAFKDTEERGLFKDITYKPASLMEEQLKDIIKRGHDVQLHFHPQWLNYKYIDDYQFELDLNLWRISSLDIGDFDRQNTLKWLFKKGRDCLEDLLKPISSAYKCSTFRAGAWCIQPEKKVLEAMQSVGIFYDFTVAPNMKLNQDLTKYNFTEVPAKSKWKFNDDVCIEDKDGIFTEFPIHTVQYGLLMLMFYFVKRMQVRKSFDKKCIGGGISNVSNPAKRILRKLFQKYHMFDFTGGLSAAELTFQFNEAKNMYKNELEYKDVELISIGHPKDFNSDRELVHFLTGINN